MSSLRALNHGASLGAWAMLQPYDAGGGSGRVPHLLASAVYNLCAAARPDE
jgi:hypothetical protein